MAWSPELDVGLLVRSAWHVVTAETQQTDLDPKSLSSLSEKNMLCHDFLVGGFKHEWIILYYFPFHIWDVILPIDSYFSSWLWKTTLNRIESMRLVRKEEWLIFQRDSRYIYFEEQVVMSKESTKCRNAQQELNFCHERRQKTFPEHPESDGWAMQRVAPPQETHTMVVGNMQQHFSPKNGWCSTSRSTAAFGLVMTKISGASRNQRNLLILISHSLGLLPVYKWL